jgi:hypothetical protein
MPEKRGFSYLNKDFTLKPPAPIIEGRNLFDLKKKSLADSYDYKIDVVYPSGRARIDFSKIIPNKSNFTHLTVKTSDFAPTPKPTAAPGTNTFLSFG